MTILDAEMETAEVDLCRRARRSATTVATPHTVPATRPRVPIGRSSVRSALSSVVDDARAGRGRALVLRGAAGSGRTLLLRDAVSTAIDCRVLRASGVEVERDLPYGTLQALCAGLVDLVGQLPAPQAQALSVAFGLTVGAAPDDLLTGLGLATLLAEASSDEPVVCIVDDAHWADEPSMRALGVAARRLEHSGVGFLFSVVTDASAPALEAVEEVRLAPMSDGELQLLLSDSLPGRLDSRVRDRLLLEARGNPQVVHDVARSTTTVGMAGGFAACSDDVDRALEQLVASRCASLTTPAAGVLLLAAAEPLGDVTVHRKAVAAAGASAEDCRAVVSTGLVEVGDVVRFVHPLVRHLVVRHATDEERRAAHRVLAEVSDDADHVAWHRGMACAGPNEPVAAELEAAAASAGRAGGAAAAAAFLERSSVLSEDPESKVRRTRRAAARRQGSGAFADALRLVDELDHQQRDTRELLLSRLVRADVAASMGRRDAARELTDVARRLAPLDAERSCEVHLRAFDVATVSGRFGTPGGVHDVAGSVRSLRAAATAATAATASTADTPLEHLLDAMATWWSGEDDVDHRVLADAVDRVCADLSSDHATATRLAMELWDSDAWEALANRGVDRARRSGELVDLARALDLRACLHVLRGELGIADAAVDEVERIARHLGVAAPESAAILLAGWRAAGADDVDRVERRIHEAALRGDGSAVTLLELASAVAHNAAGRYEQALHEASTVMRRDEPFVSTWAAAEVVEAALRAGRPDDATHAVELVRSASGASGSDWALGIEQRCSALLDDSAADDHFAASIESLERSAMLPDLARTHLLYGEWLRRQKRRVDAREQLRIALRLFDSFGATAFAARASAELRATGEQARRRSPETAADLTERESQVAALASEGCSNPEIGTQLFISSRTVEYHLGKVFSKLGISSRAQLAGVLGDTAPGNTAPGTTALGAA